MPLNLDPNRFVGFESRKAYRRRCETGFWDAFVQTPPVIDIGYQGGDAAALPILEGAIGIERHYPGYDGLRLPFSDGSVGTVHSSHCLEHLTFPEVYLEEWFRVLRVGGTMILMVPSAFLYERRLTVPPSRWSPEHLSAWTPSSLCRLIENSLEPNSYRVRHLSDVDDGYDYSLPITVHPVGGLEIEMVIQKIVPPTWQVEP
jgi:SAM-dependent methyltransferase